jgi:hypothetical protein
MRKLLYGSFIEAWQRQLPQIPCPLKIEDDGERLFRHLNPRCNNGIEWEEATDVYPEVKWRHIEWDAFHDILPDRGISGITPHTSAVTFLGVVDGKHRCRPATEEEIQAHKDAPITVGGRLGEILANCVRRVGAHPSD